ncbi:flagellar export chaperone FlgN [bacterium]|nr:flagellar export chaperone FlgN [FCB group bacterium]MBL7190147.1 flagellar export chaperone FlgN [bacterium]
MEANIAEIQEIVERETEILEALTDLLYQQKMSAIRGDIELLNRLTLKQSEAYARIAELETERLKLIAPIAEELEVAPEEVTLSLLKQRSGDNSGGRWDKLLMVLKPLILKIRRAVRVNSLYFKRSMQLNEERMRNVLHFQSGNAMYGRNGVKKEADKKHSIILNRQI